MQIQMLELLTTMLFFDLTIYVYLGVASPKRGLRGLKIPQQ